MPATEVRVYTDGYGGIPFVEWLGNLRHKNRVAYKKCLALILELAERGHEMRRPHSDYLRDGIYELRATGTPYRMLYFFSGKNLAVLSHGIRKTKKVPPREIDTAIARKKRVEKDPEKYTAEFETPDDE